MKELDLSKEGIRSLIIADQKYYAFLDVLKSVEIKNPEKVLEEINAKGMQANTHFVIMKEEGKATDYANEETIRIILSQIRPPQNLTPFDKTLGALMGVPKPDKN